MRIRYKPWARKELEESSFYREDSEEYQGKWKNEFARAKQPLFVELGCGKGSFIAQKAVRHPENNYLAIDLVDPMLGLAKRKIEEVYQAENKNIDNVLLTRFDVERINLILSEKDEVEGIYINFCNPWPRGKHHKKRLTHTRQLKKYREFLKLNAHIYFKTDDDELFTHSLEYFKEAGFEVEKLTYDLENEPDFWENIQTEHEKMFMEQGIKIKALIAINSLMKHEISIK
ncbi:MAG: tRNA (guanosine(46)-N7)-methyltransferase TrmB [Clostridia bacterium]|nr:tRNA (guanosine(46)-N7)-methyltransferase TrmB [Clostridia bacterium]